MSSLRVADEELRAHKDASSVRKGPNGERSAEIKGPHSCFPTDKRSSDLFGTPCAINFKHFSRNILLSPVLFASLDIENWDIEIQARDGDPVLRFYAHFLRAHRYADYSFAFDVAVRIPLLRFKQILA